MASVRPLTDLTVADLWREVKDPATLWGRCLTRNVADGQAALGESDARTGLHRRPARRLYGPPRPPPAG
jgi:hypothetical protein